MLVSLHAVCAKLERELAAVRESSTQAGRAREELGIVMSRAAQELEVTLDPNASSADVTTIIKQCIACHGHHLIKVLNGK